jgi:hypothetical protein
MIDLLANLKPFAGSHSIKEAVIALFLASKIMKPNEYESLIADENQLGKDFQQFEVLNPTQIKFEGPNVSILKGENAGFKFTGFDKGKPEKILRGINEENRFFYSFHLFNYKNWNLFNQRIFLKRTMFHTHWMRIRVMTKKNILIVWI